MIDQVLCYIVYPIYIAFVCCFFMHFAIDMCRSLIVEIFSQILIEAQCVEIMKVCDESETEEIKKH